MDNEFNLLVGICFYIIVGGISALVIQPRIDRSYYRDRGDYAPGKYIALWAMFITVAWPIYFIVRPHKKLKRQNPIP